MEGSLGPSRRHIVLLTPPPPRDGWAEGARAPGVRGWVLWERGEELGFPVPDVFTTLSSGLDGTATSDKCRGEPRRAASPPGCQIPGDWSQRLLAPWWVPGQRCSGSREELARGERGALLYSSMVNQLRFLFPVLNIITLSPWLLWMFALHHNVFARNQ